MTDTLDIAPSPQPARTRAAPAPSPDEVFVRVLELPTASLRAARAAVALQLDRLSPLPPGEVLTDVVRLDATPTGGARFAVALASPAILDGAASAAREVEVDGRWIEVRFGRAAIARPDRRLQAACVAALCAVMVAVGLSRRLEIESEATASRIGDASLALSRLAALKTRRDAAVRAWSGETAAGVAPLLACGLERMSLGAGGAPPIATLVVGRGGLVLTAARLPTQAEAQVLSARGYAVEGSRLTLPSGACR